MLQHNLVRKEVYKGEVVPDSIKAGESVHIEGCIQVMATIQIVVPNSNYENNINYMAKSLSIIDELSKENRRLNKLLEKKRVIDPEFATSQEAAGFLSVDPSFLTKRQGKTFKLGTHFFKPKNESIVRWKISALTDWLTGKQNNSNNVDSKLENLLKRR